MAGCISCTLVLYRSVGGCWGWPHAPRCAEVDLQHSTMPAPLTTHEAEAIWPVSSVAPPITTISRGFPALVSQGETTTRSRVACGANNHVISTNVYHRSSQSAKQPASFNPVLSGDANGQSTSPGKTPSNCITGRTSSQLESFERRFSGLIHKTS